MKRFLVAVSLVAGGIAHADETVWDRALVDDDLDARHKAITYKTEMTYGDEYIMHATADKNFREQKRLFDRGVTAYKNAIKAMPRAAEPHIRLGTAIWTFRLQCKELTALCTPGRFDPGAALQVVHHWREFSRLAPLDPRGTHFLFDRAILHTRLAGTQKDATQHLEHAAADYEAYLDRTDGGMRFSINNILGGGGDTTRLNLAETYMMLGRLDDAITMYKLAIQQGNSDTTVIYGLAVALDRDDQKTLARRLIAEKGDSAFTDDFQASIRSGQSFYIPDGEVHYYMALAHEALGRPQQAIAEYDRFIKSGAHPQFHARARANRAVLVDRKDKHPAPQTPRPPETLRFHAIP